MALGAQTIIGEKPERHRRKKASKGKIFIVIGLLLSPVTGYCQVNVNQIDSIFSDWNKAGEPGGAVGILKNGELLFSKGYGIADLEHDIPITPKTVFYLASVSKQFTAFCILLLEEKGLISLEDEIQKYLPDFPGYEAPIKISHLIHHTSGLRDYSTLIDLQGRSYLEDISEKEVYDLIKRQKYLNFRPGDEYTYSNSGYFLLAKIIEVVSKQSLREFSKKNIFDPLGMNSTTFLDDNRMLIKNRAFSYDRTEGKAGFNNIIRRFDLVGSGGVYSSIEDLILWDKNFDANTLGKGGQSIIEKMHQEDTLSNGQRNSYAFGLENRTYKGIKRVSHSGSNAGFRTFFIRFPEHNLSILLLSNRRDGNLNKAFGIVDLLLKDKLVHTPVPATANTVDDRKTENRITPIQPKDLAILPGSYYSPELKAHYQISTADNELVLSVNNGECTPLKMIDGTTLASETFGIFSFEKKGGKIIGFNLSIDRIKGIYFNRIKK